MGLSCQQKGSRRSTLRRNAFKGICKFCYACLCIAEEHVSIRQYVELVIYACKARIHAPLAYNHLLCLINIQYRHTIDRAVLIGTGNRGGGIISADGKGDV